MKKFVCILLILVLLFTTLSLSSCHGKARLPEFVLPAEFDSEASYSITFWAKNDNNKYQQEIYKKAVADFEALYPNIDVNLRLFADYGLIYRDVITNIQTSTTPNICITYPDHIATYNTGDNIIVSLDELMANEKYGLGGTGLKFDGVKKSEIVTAFLDEGKIDGTQYALPFMRSTEAVYINVDLLESLGYELPEALTWDFLFEVSRAAMALGKETVIDDKGKETEVYVANGQSVLIPFIYKSTDNMMIQYLKQAGAGYSTDDGEILLFNETAEGLLYTVAESVEEGAFSTFKISSYPGNYLNAGQCLFAIDSTAGATWMGHDAPNIDIPEDQLYEFELAVKPIPQLDPENPQMISQGPSICIFNKRDAGEVVASWLFAQFLLTNDVQIEYSTTEGYVPVTTRAQQSDEYLDYLSRRGEEHPENFYQAAKIDASMILLNNLENTFVTPVFNGSTSVRNAAGQLIENVAKAVRRGKTVDAEFMEALYPEVTALYRLDQLGGESDPEQLGELPIESTILIISFVVIWLILGAVWLFPILKNKMSEKGPKSPNKKTDKS